MKGRTMTADTRLLEFGHGDWDDRQRDVVTDLGGDREYSGNVVLRMTTRSLSDLTDDFPIEFVSWSDLEAQIAPIEWAWSQWLPLGTLTLLAGQSGSGKSALCLNVASTFICGSKWPDASDCGSISGSVMWLDFEAAQAINVERAKSTGLPLDRILLPFRDPFHTPQLNRQTDKRLIERALDQRNDVRLLVLDSLSGAHGMDENDASVISVVIWLAELARDARIAVLLVHHLRKTRSDERLGEVTLDRVRGSSALVQPARVVWAIDSPDPLDQGNWRLHVIKSNLARFPEPIGFHIGDNAIPRFGPPPSPPRSTSMLQEAVGFLLERLSAGPQKGTEMFDEAKERGISPATLKRAKASLHVVSKKRSDGSWWILSPDRGDTPGGS